MQITEYDENKLLHLLLEMGERLLDAGAEINRVEDTLERIGLAYGNIGRKASDSYKKSEF